jgi:hypothetical protein
MSSLCIIETLRAGGTVPEVMASKIRSGVKALRSRPVTSHDEGKVTAERVRPKFFVGGRAPSGTEGNGTIFCGQYKDAMQADAILQVHVMFILIMMLMMFMIVYVSI